MNNKLNDPYEYDKTTGHYFCKYCGNNYLLKTHKEECQYKGGGPVGQAKEKTK